MPVAPASRVFCAVDTVDVEKARVLASRLAGRVGGLKLGLEFFVANGPAGVRAVIGESGMPFFLDLKFHDIPNTVAGAVRAALPLKPAFLTIHASGGPAMIAAAAEEAAKAGPDRPKVLAVTVLTSLDANDLEAVGQVRDTAEQVTRLAKLAEESGADGVVCSPMEVAVLRAALGPDFTLMVPGIRPAWSVAGDQKRIMTPAQAVEAGADHLVIGRPITGAEDPGAAADRVANEIAGVA